MSRVRLAGEAGPVASALVTRHHGDCHVPRRAACGVPVLHSLDASSTSSGATTKNARRMWLNVPPPDTSHSVGKRAGPGGGNRTARQPHAGLPGLAGGRGRSGWRGVGAVTASAGLALRRAGRRERRAARARGFLDTLRRALLNDPRVRERERQRRPCQLIVCLGPGDGATGGAVSDTMKAERAVRDFLSFGFPSAVCWWGHGRHLGSRG